MTRVRRLLCCLVGLFLAACASPGSSPASDPASAALLVTLHDFKTGKRFELASESHTDRVAYYSGARADAARKVLADEAMAPFADFLGRQGFADHAQPGRAPSLAPGGVISWGLVLERGSDASHWLVGKGSAPGEWQEFQRCRDSFLELYNIAVSFQTVRNQDGERFFDEHAQSAAGGMSDGKRK